MSANTPAATKLLAKGLNPDDGGAEIVARETASGGAVFSLGSIIWPDFVPEGAGTRLTEVLEMDVKGPMRLLSPLISRSARKQVPEVHRRLKKVLEQGPQ